MSPLENMVAHAEAGAALDLRLGRLIAWFKRQDLRLLGYTSYLAFAANRVDWSDGWLREVVALVESPLERVKAAVCIGLIPLRLAVRAPGQTSAEDEARWLADNLVKRAERKDRGRRAEPKPEVDLSGKELVTIQAARDLARIHMGAPVGDTTADRHILRHWQRRDAVATQREGQAKPPAPEPLPPWCNADDPATALVGPWVEPASLDAALHQLDIVLAKRRSRVLDLGVLYRQVVAERAWAESYGSVGDMVRVCGLEQRTLQRAKQLVDALDALPDTTAAVACGEITLDEARHIASIATEDTEQEWLCTVGWYTAPDFARLVELASRGVPVLEIASGVVDKLIDELTLTDRVTFTGLRRQMPAPRHQAIPRDLPEAAAWFLAHARPPPQRGCGRIKERDGFCCRNPECRRPTMRLHAHHEQQRSHGGSDHPINLLGLCPACHLRGVHSGAISVQTVGSLRIWSYAGRRVLEVDDAWLRAQSGGAAA